MEKEDPIDLKSKSQKNLNRSQSAPTKQKLSLTDIENVNTDSGIINEVEEENDIKKSSSNLKSSATMKIKSKITRPVTYSQSNRKKTK